MISNRRFVGCTHNLTHVENNDGRLEANTDTSDETTSNDDTEAVANTSDHLNDNTDHVDAATKDDSEFTTDYLSHVATNKSTEESTGRQDGDDQRGVRGADSSRALTGHCSDEQWG